MLGVSGDTQELLEERKLHLKQIKNLTKQVADLEEEIENAEHESDRWHREELRDAREDVEDSMHQADRRVQLAKDRADDSVYDATRRQMESHRAEIAKLQATISAKDVEIKNLKLAQEEEQADTDLAIQEGILEYRQTHLDELNVAEVKIAKLEGDVKAAQADAKAKDQVIAALTKLIDKQGTTQETLIEAVTDVAPKFNLEKLGFEVNVPVQTKTEQKKNN